MSPSRRGPKKLSEFQVRWMLNLYPPFLFNRIHIAKISGGFRRCRVHVARSLFTRNLQGSTFGGTIFSAADPIYAILHWQIHAHQGRRVQAWLRKARISYLKPADSRLTLDFVLLDEDVERACEALDRDGRYAHTYRTEAVSRDGVVCAVVETEIYLRTPRGVQKEVSAF